MGMSPLFVLIGNPRREKGVRRVRKYRSQRRQMRAMFSSDREFSARVNGQAAPPVRQRRKYKVWR